MKFCEQNTIPVAICAIKNSTMCNRLMDLPVQRNLPMHLQFRFKVSDSDTWICNTDQFACQAWYHMPLFLGTNFQLPKQTTNGANIHSRCAIKSWFSIPQSQKARLGFSSFMIIKILVSKWMFCHCPPIFGKKKTC